MIPFNRPCVTGREIAYIQRVFDNKRFAGDNEFTKECHAVLNKFFYPSLSLLTTSGTHALEMAIILADIGPGDEIIMPSYTFTSSAASAVMRGGVPVFVDIRPDTLNIDEKLIVDAVTPRTKAIMPVHYAGVPCAMDEINSIAKEYNLFVIEDAAQAIMSSYKGRPAGTIGDFGCFSFHETKNLQCGEGGSIVVNKNSYFERAELLREKGTDRSRFWRGEVDKYTWRDMGSSYLPSELNAAFILAQLESREEITSDRLNAWNFYADRFAPLAEAGLIDIPRIPEYAQHNGHIFYLKVKDESQRDELIAYLKDIGVYTVFHYVPLHTSPAGIKFGRFHGTDNYTTKEASRLLRLPLYYMIEEEDQIKVIEAVYSFFKKEL